MTLRQFIANCFVAVAALSASAIDINYEAEAIVNSGSGAFAPYYIASNRHGILTQQTNALVSASIGKELDLSERFSYSFNVKGLAGWSSSTDYLQFNQEISQLEPQRRTPPYVWLQELYGSVKYRSIFLTVGLKEQESLILNSELSSGDLVESGNSRPIPEIRAGFIDFQDFPFTNGWVQLKGEVSYGKMLDNNWMKEHYNYYNYHYNLGALYTYKHLHLRSKASMPFTVTVGMQSGGLFGGTTYFYHKGKLTRVHECPQSAMTFLKMLIPMRNEGSAFHDGSSLGSWDVLFRYRFRDKTVLKAYIQKPWEDGTGIGWLNGFDGIWGIEYQAPKADAIVSGAVIEYLDFTNQSGPIHWYPGDAPGTTIDPSHATGGDMYYNNHQQNPYMNYGMSIGTPFLRAPLYNTDGYMAYVDNRVRGFHIGVNGHITPELKYRILGSWRKGWGDGRYPTTTTRETTSVMLEGIYTVAKIPGLRVKAQFAFDAGNMFGNNVGGCVSVSYSGLLKL